MNDLGKVQRSLQRALSEMPDAWVSICSDYDADLIEPLDTWVDAINADVDLGEVMHTAGAGAGRILVGFARVQPPKRMRSALAALFEIVEAVDPAATINRFRESEYTPAKTAGSLYVHAMVRWRDDAFERQRGRMAEESESGQLVLGDADLGARAGLLEAVTSWAIGTSNQDELRYWVASESFEIEVDRIEAGRIFRWAAGRDVSRGSLRVVHPGHWARRAVLEYRGGGVLCETTFEQDRPAASALVGLAKEQLAALAPWVESAAALPNPMSGSRLDTVMDQHMIGRDIPFHSMSVMILAEPRKIADAFPVLHLGPKYDGRLPGGGGYRTSPASDGWILEHHEANAWFEAEAFADPYRLRTPDALDRARAELDQLLVHNSDVLVQMRRLTAG